MNLDIGKLGRCNCIFSQRESSPLSAAVILLPVGARFESDQNAGLAHFLEHIVFKGCETYPGAELISIAAEKLGADLNAFTSYEYTGYYLKVPQQNYLSAIKILLNVVFKPIILSKDVDSERGVIEQEINMYNDRPDELVWIDNMEKRFPNHPLGRKITGDIDTISEISAEALTDFHRQYYRTGPMTFVGVGDFSVIEKNQIRKIISGYIDDFADGAVDQNIDTKFEQEIPEVGSLQNRINKKTEQSHLVYSLRGINRRHEFEWPLKIGLTYLAAGYGSRLYSLIREERGWAYYLYGNISEFSDTGIISFAAGVEKIKTDEVLSIIRTEIKKLSFGDYSEELFTRAKNYLLGNLATQFDGAEDMAYFIAKEHTLSFPTRSLDQIIATINKIKPEDMVSAWRSIDDSAVVSIVE